MNIHEYQAKALLHEFGVPISRGVPVLRAADSDVAAKTLGGPIWVVKSQIHAGGRGKGKFKEASAGDKGGVRIAKSVAEANEFAKQMLGAARQFVHADETCQRFPELALLAGAVLTYAAATSPAIPTGSWDRQPQRTPGRLRRLLAQAVFPTEFPFPARLRAKMAVTDHLPKGFWGQRRRPTPTSASSRTADLPQAASEVA